jgi:hypothetical protein
LDFFAAKFCLALVVLVQCVSVGFRAEARILTPANFLVQSFCNLIFSRGFLTQSTAGCIFWMGAELVGPIFSSPFTQERALSSFLQLKEHALDLVFLLVFLTAPVNIGGSCHALICFAMISLLITCKLGFQVSFLTPRAPKLAPGFSGQGVILVPVPWGPRWVLGLVLTIF